MVQDFGWGGDHAGKLHALQTAIKHLCGAGKVRERFDAGTYPLVTCHERDFPEHLRPAFNRIVPLFGAEHAAGSLPSNQFGCVGGGVGGDVPVWFASKL
jgi:hypothetical protein